MCRVNMGIAQRRCSFAFVIVVVSRRPFYLDLYFPYIICAAFLVNRYSVCIRRINTLQRLPKLLCSHLLHLPSHLPTNVWRVNKFYMVEEPRRERISKVATTRKHVLYEMINRYLKAIFSRNIFINTNDIS